MLTEENAKNELRQERISLGNPQETVCKEKQMGFLTSKANIPIAQC